MTDTFPASSIALAVQKLRVQAEPAGWAARAGAVMNWYERARSLFDVPKPVHFTDHRHCCECAEHDETLSAHDVESIGLEQLGHPSWDPLCFSSAEGLKYYLPALVRLTLETLDDPGRVYLDQFLFHLVQDGEDNRLVGACSSEQRVFVAEFLEFLLDNRSAPNEAGARTADDILRAHAIWAAR